MKFYIILSLSSCCLFRILVGPIDPKALLLPFLRMIRSQTISGPYVRKAIESIQSFLLGDILLGDPQHTCDALDEIVVAITRYNSYLKLNALPSLTLISIHFVGVGLSSQMCKETKWSSCTC